MTVRMVDVRMDTPSFLETQKLLNYIDGQSGHLTRWGDFHLEAQLYPADHVPGSPEYIHARFWFDETPSFVNQQFIQRLREKADGIGISWFELRYHECDHDVDGNPSPCDRWDFTKTKGTIPEDL